MGYVSPGWLYLEKQKTVETFDDVLAYAEFLRNEAGLNGILPVDLGKIFGHFQIPETLFAPLPQQQGLLLDAKRGIIVINSNDPEKRQKFTTAHELVELLFKALPQGKDLGRGWELKRPGGFKETTKEFLCNWTAANLLMPPPFIENEIKKLGVTFECARSIAEKCEVSLSAALVQVARNSQRQHFVVLWRMKNKPTEINNTNNASQMTMFGVQNIAPAKKLRVEWSLGGVNSPYIPKDKSVENSSLIYQAWETNRFTSGRVNISLDNRNASWFSSENLPFTTDGERYVISLIGKI
jgi:Zn-dependent peptidase ImmA (M78 family)